MFQHNIVVFRIIVVNLFRMANLEEDEVLLEACVRDIRLPVGAHPTLWTKMCKHWPAIKWHDISRQNLKSTCRKAVDVDEDGEITRWPALNSHNINILILEKNHILLSRKIYKTLKSLTSIAVLYLSKNTSGRNSWQMPPKAVSCGKVSPSSRSLCRTHCSWFWLLNRWEDSHHIFFFVPSFPSRKENFMQLILD